MPISSRSDQEWILDRLVGSLGIDALMPGFTAVATSPVIGMNVADIDLIKKASVGLGQMRTEYVRAAKRRLAIAERAASADHPEAARRHFHYAALCFGMAQYLIQEDGNPEKLELHERMVRCYRRVVELSSYPIEVVEIPFEDDPPFHGESVPGILHLPVEDAPTPCVIFLPGTDMFKEQVPNPEDNMFVKRGIACLSLDGPGQGESLLRMLKVKVETWNYERAVSAAIDYLEGREEIDSSRIAIFGVSTGSYWSVRAAIAEARGKDRIRASAGLMSQWESGFVTEFQHAQPAFKRNYMYMAGIDDEAEFDRQAPLHTLEGIISEVTCPVYVGTGEYDELCTPDTVKRIMAELETPHDLWVYSGEFHPMGNVAVEAWEGALDWILDRLEGSRAHTGGLTEVRDGRNSVSPL